MFDIHQSVIDPDTGEFNHGAFHKYAACLAHEFADSDEGQIVVAKAGSVTWAQVMMEYAADYLGVTPPKMSAGHFDEVVFEIFPRKVSADPEDVPAMIMELRAFWQFLQRVYRLPNADKILAVLDKRAVARLEKEMADPRNHGMAKSIVMTGQKLGFDMTTEEGMQAFMSYYNSQIAGGAAASAPFPTVMEDDEPDDDDYVNDFDDGFDAPEPVNPGPTPKERAELRKKKRKAERQARKRARRQA